jgi:hypothetical protein
MYLFLGAAPGDCGANQEDVAERMSTILVEYRSDQALDPIFRSYLGTTLHMGTPF